MKLEIKIQKLHNLYLFISDLSQWNELTCFPKRKEAWIKKVGRLNKNDLDKLKTFSHILQASDSHLENVFLFEDQKTIWTDLAKKTDKNSLSKIKSIMNHFAFRFDKIWEKERKKLNKISKLLGKKAAELGKNLNHIELLCGLTKNQTPKKININLFISAGGRDLRAWSFKEIIVLECSGWPLGKIDYLINNTLVHECFHIFFKKNKKMYSKFDELTKKNAYFINDSKLKFWGEKIVFEEALISSFAPEGYLGEKFSKIDNKKIAAKKLSKNNFDVLSKLRYYCALNMYDLAKKYVDNKKSIDNNYLEKAVKTAVVFLSKEKGQRNSSFCPLN